MLYLVGKLGGIASTEDGYREKYIARLEGEVVSLEADRDLYRDIVLKEYPHRVELPAPIVEAPEVNAGSVRIRHWPAARGILARAARDKKARGENPIHQAKP